MLGREHCFDSQRGFEKGLGFRDSPLAGAHEAKMITNRRDVWMPVAEFRFERGQSCGEELVGIG